MSSWMWSVKVDDEIEGKSLEDEFMQLQHFKKSLSNNLPPAIFFSNNQNIHHVSTYFLFFWKRRSSYKATAVEDLKPLCFHGSRQDRLDSAVLTW